MPGQPRVSSVPLARVWRPARQPDRSLALRNDIRISSPRDEDLSPAGPSQCPALQAADVGRREFGHGFCAKSQKIDSIFDGDGGYNRGDDVARVSVDAATSIDGQKGKIMSDVGVQPVAEAAPESAGLTQWQRLMFTFTAPSKTFEDIKRGNKSWWLPLIVGALVSYLLFAAITQKIGLQQVVENQIRMDAKAQERMAQLTPEQHEAAMKFSVGLTEGIFLGGPVLAIGFVAVLSLGLLGTINFMFGGKAKFGSLFAVFYYAWLPMMVKQLLGVIVIYSGVAPESFNIKNFAPTNLGAFLDPAETNKALYTLATSLDAVTIWTLVLLGMGTAIVAGVKRGSGYIAVFGWWAIFVLIGVGWAAVMG